MKDLQDFEISIFKLKEGTHHYQYSIDRKFFSSFENSLLDNANCEVDLNLEKTETMIILNFGIKGTIELTCDRSLEKFDQPFDISEKLILKYGEEEEEISDEMVLIHWKTETINVAQYIYEFIGLAVPMRKIHPKLKDKENKEDIIFSTSGDSDDDSIDPRWNVLKNLKK